MAHYQPTTVKELLLWSYANLAMAQDGVNRGIPTYDKKSFMIRTKLFKGLLNDNMKMATLFKDEKWKIENGARCVYCGATENLSVDHMFARITGGTDSIENLVCSCRSCNSSKGKKDMMTWFKERDKFPPLMVLRRYLKLVYQQCDSLGILDSKLDEVDDSDFPFKFASIPMRPPKPTEITLE